MKIFLSAGIFVLLAGVVAQAQEPANVTPKPAGLGKPDAVPKEEANIRAYIELLRTDVRKSKSQIMAEVMQFDAAQSVKFWPIYKEFENEYSALGDQIVAIVREFGDHYGTLTDPGAEKLGTQVLNIEQQRNALKRKYFEKVKVALGGITAMRFLQVENQLERLVDLQIAAQLPVAGER